MAESIVILRNDLEDDSGLWAPPPRGTDEDMNVPLESLGEEVPAPTFTASERKEALPSPPTSPAWLLLKLWL